MKREKLFSLNELMMEPAATGETVIEQHKIHGEEARIRIY